MQTKCSNRSRGTLKPGGVLGVVEHRAKPGTSIDVMKKTGYMTEEYVIGLAKQAGLKLEGESEINANPKDTTNHPDGVWSLPPNSRVCQTDGRRRGKRRMRCAIPQPSANRTA